MEKEVELTMYNRTLSKHCFICGRKLKRETYLSHYDSQNGKPVFRVVLFCPKYLFKVFSHITYTFDEDGEEIIERY